MAPHIGAASCFSLCTAGSRLRCLAVLEGYLPPLGLPLDAGMPYLTQMFVECQQLAVTGLLMG